MLGGSKMKCEHEELGYVGGAYRDDIECTSCGLDAIGVHDELRKEIDRLRKAIQENEQ